MEMKARYVNGYRLIHKPDHPNSMKSENWDGYVYEHIFVATNSLGRPLRENEVVHHLDGDRSNNRSENLLVLERSQHWRLHLWLEKGAPFEKSEGVKRVNSEKAKVEEPHKVCLICDVTLQGSMKKFCSPKCYNLSKRKVQRPSKEELLQEVLNRKSWTALGKKYGVSDNAVRGWVKNYGLLLPILSQAGSTLPEGAETTGEVQTS